MKSSKDTIYDYIQQTMYTQHEHTPGISTTEIATTLKMHRSNVSALLNELVKEGKLIKTDTRPVYYELPKPTDEPGPTAEAASFTHLIGFNGSLRNAIQLAKAAILYPRSSLNILLSSQMGCGTSSFAYTIFQYAQESGVLGKEAAYVKINCKNYSKNVLVLNDELFGSEGDFNSSCFARARHGMLFIDNVDLLEAKQQSRIFEFLEIGLIYSEDRSISYDCKSVFLVLACSPQSGLQLNRKIPVTIELPELKDRSLKERFELVNYFFSVEAANSNRTIEVTTETVKGLLLTEFVYNVKELELEIKSACAKGYVRVINDLDMDIDLYLSDFKSQIRKSLLKSKVDSAEIDAMLGSSEITIYDKNTGYQNQYSSAQTNEMYSEITRQYEELSSRGINNASIRNVISTHLQNLFRRYSYYNAFDETTNLEQLSKIVDPRVIDLVSDWLERCKSELRRNFQSNVFYGLCLHINSLLTLTPTHQRVEDSQIVKIVQDYPREYAASGQFASTLKHALNLDLPVDEIVLLTMFLIEVDEASNQEHPVLLYILHGNGTASSLRDVTNGLTQSYNAYSYDLALGIEPRQAMEEIKALIVKINRGPGVIVIYDMGSIKTMLEAISEEIDVKIRFMNIPITLIGIDIARKCTMETDIDYVYHMANLEINSLKRSDDKHNDIIVTLCHTGEGGALQLKRYIEQYSKLGMKTYALAISARDELLKEVLALRKTYRIHTFVGTYDPKLFGIPFIPIGKIFENSREDLDRVLMFEPVNSFFFDYDDVYKYLEEQFKYVSIPKLKNVLPGIIDELSLYYTLSEDQRIGLFMHLACLVERLLEGKKASENLEKNKLIALFEDDYIVMSKTLKSLEKTFKIIIDDNELATIIMIVKKL